MIRGRRPRLKGLPFNKLIPNILTVSATCSGLTAIHFSLRGMWEAAIFAILVAAILDGLDGRIARILNATSKFGAELDSLSDFVSFGVAPALTLYLWKLQDIGRFGWVVVLFFVVCCALRLARFNTDLDAPKMPVWAYNFFTGVPSPAGALLALFPLVLSLEFDIALFRHPAFVAVFTIMMGALMVSRIPTYSFKKFKVPHAYVMPTLLVVGMLVALLVTAPWTMLSIIGVLYLCSLPHSVRTFARLRKAAGEITGEELTEDTSDEVAEDAEDTPEK